MAPAIVAFLGLHLKPPVRELTRDATAVEARTLARANRLVLRALPRAAAAGAIGRAALAFAVSADAGAPAGRPRQRAGPAGGSIEPLRRLAVGLTRVRAVESVSLLVRAGDAPASRSGGPDPASAARLPAVEVEAAEFERAGAALLPDRLYVVSAEEDDGERPRPRGALGRPAPRALPSGRPD